MKQYALFVEPDKDDAALFLGGMFQRGVSGLGTAGNLSRIWQGLADSGERIVGIRETALNDQTGGQTFDVRTLPKDVKQRPGEELEFIEPDGLWD